jgi:hypothetical protein
VGRRTPVQMAWSQEEEEESISTVKDMDRRMVLQVHTVTGLRANTYPTLRTPTEVTAPPFPFPLKVLHTTPSRPIALQTDTSPGTPSPPSPKKARHKWQTGRGPCPGRQCPVRRAAPHWVPTRPRRSRASSGIIPRRVAVWASILPPLSLGKWGSSRSPSLSSIGRWA